MYLFYIPFFVFFKDFYVTSILPKIKSSIFFSLDQKSYIICFIQIGSRYFWFLVFSDISYFFSYSGSSCSSWLFLPFFATKNFENPSFLTALYYYLQWGHFPILICAQNSFNISSKALFIAVVELIPFLKNSGSFLTFISERI